jgi:hypothetical protein
LPPVRLPQFNAVSVTLARSAYRAARSVVGACGASRLRFFVRLGGTGSSWSTIF